MDRNDLIAEIVDRTGQTKKAVSEMVSAYEESIYEAVRLNEPVALHGFIKIERKKRKGHKGNDLRNGGLTDIPDHESVKVSPGKILKECIKEQ